MLWQRIISALVGIPLIIWASYIGGFWFKFGVGIIILLGLYEYGRMMRNRGYKTFFIFGYVAGLLIIGSAWVTALIPGEILFVILLLHVFPLILGMVSLEELTYSFTGVFLFAWTLSHLLIIRETFPQGFNYIVLCFIITWTTDTGAYFSGRFLGRHKLSPIISPNKTVEGAIGGTLLCVLVVFFLSEYFNNLPLGVLLTVTFLASLAGQAGDLLESAVKRWAGVKDSGNIIPGHGGILDRFDSLTMVVPLVFYSLKPFLIG
ncbi:MAG: phosphatidate cytidylyltransferase [Bacillota bacterium]|jgi:phosphatidate cytidylyltransferase